MTEIIYLKGDATNPPAAGIKILCHICNDIGVWGKGFVLAISQRWPAPERAYRHWHAEHRTNDFGLGAVQFVPVKSELLVANMVGQRGIHRGSGTPPIRYDAVAHCLEEVGEKALELGASVHMPRIGCGRAGGEWSQIEPLIQAQLCAKGITVTVYDFD